MSTAIQDATNEPSVVAKAVQQRLEIGKAKLHIARIFYGDQANIPETPTVCVEAGPMHAEYAGAPFVTDNRFIVYILVYHSKINIREGIQLTRLECDQLAEAIQDELHVDKTMGDTVISGFVTDIDPNYARRGNVLLCTSRLTWMGMNKSAI